MQFVSARAAEPISAAAIANAAADLGCDVAAVQAVAHVESRRAPFQSDGRPTILYERHIFRRRTGRRFDADHPRLSGPRGNYGKYAEQYDKLTAAMALDADAALEATSWGAFQIMGFNHEACGFATVEDFVAAMVESADRHLEAFTGFLLRNGLDAALRGHDWARFARGYNGPAFRDNAYDQKLAAAWARFAEAPAAAPTPTTPTTTARDDGPPARVRSVADLQRALVFLALDPGPVDNRMGPRTRAAIRAFQRFARLDEDGAPTPTLRAAVQAAAHMLRSFEAAEAA
jgi:hypothetical protein